ncbi:Cyclin-dependent kinase 4 inhibitor C [Oryzias melastigma]|uniref:Cyclin-dependent kinase 4 inhibitor C n=1 Tax=Oryzias melastigma TaxID=30732 RepID=A0A834KVC5_ORYME|nr:Cyclin-dependent kinase 4 inhibitor C [Oryzias melastigma]
MASRTVQDELCNASARGDLPQVLSLLQQGAKVNGLNSFNRTALQVVKLACSELVDALLHAGADPNVRDHVLKLTVTHDAAREGFTDTVRVLINHDAAVNVVDEKGNLPLHLAAREGHLEMVQLLIEHTANPRAANAQGSTPWELAHDCNRKEAAEFIWAHLGDDPTSK